MGEATRIKRVWVPVDWLEQVDWQQKRYQPIWENGYACVGTFELGVVTDTTAGSKFGSPKRTATGAWYERVA